MGANAADLEITSQGQHVGGTGVKKYSPRRVPTPPTGSSKGGVKNELSPARPKSLLSNKVTGVLPLLRDLKPRFLEGLTPVEFKSALAEATYRKFPANSVITNQDQSAEHLYLLLTGRARFFFVTERGQEVILLWIPPGDISVPRHSYPRSLNITSASRRPERALLLHGSVLRSEASLRVTQSCWKMPFT